MRALWVGFAVVAAALAGGCSSNDPCNGVLGACIALTVDGHGSVDTLRLGLSGAASAERIAPTRQTLTTLPVYVALQLTHAGTQSGALFSGGDVRIDVEGTRAGALVGAASTHVTLGSGDHVGATVTLGAGALPAGDDLSTAPADLALPCSAGDLAGLASDPHNCGSCGHDCLGGACTAGQCQPMVVVAATEPVFGVAVDADNVYFSRTGGGTGGISRQPLAGGAPIPIFSSSTSSIFGLALAGGKLIVDDTHQHLETLPVPGGAVALTPGFDVALSGFAADATNVYYSSGADFVLRSIDLPLAAGSTPSDVGTLSQPASALASDGTTLYYATVGTIGGITLPAGTPQSFGTIANIRGLAVDGNTLWATTATGNVLQLARSGNVVSVVSTLVGQSQPTGIAADAKAVYWANDGDGTVMRVAR